MDSAIHPSISLACGLTPLIAYSNSIPLPPYLSPFGINVWAMRIGKRSRRSGLQTLQSTVFYWTKPNPQRHHVLAVLLGRPSAVCSKRPPLGTPEPTVRSNKSIQILWDLWKCNQLAVPVAAVFLPTTRPPLYGSTSSSQRTKLSESLKSSRRWLRTYPEERSSSSIRIVVENSYLMNSRSILRSMELFGKPRRHTHHNKTALLSG